LELAVESADNLRAIDAGDVGTSPGCDGPNNQRLSGARRAVQKNALGRPQARRAACQRVVKALAQPRTPTKGEMCACIQTNVSVTRHLTELRIGLRRVKRVSTSSHTILTCSSGPPIEPYLASSCDAVPVAVPCVLASGYVSVARFTASRIVGDAAWP